MMFNMVNLINPIFENLNQNHMHHENNIANGMPPSFTERPNLPITTLNNSNSFNQQFHKPKRYSESGSPSNGSPAEAYLKARILFQPIFMQDVAATKYSMISKMSVDSNQIRNNLIRFI